MRPGTGRSNVSAESATSAQAATAATARGPSKKPPAQKGEHGGADEEHGLHDETGRAVREAR